MIPDIVILSPLLYEALSVVTVIELGAAPIPSDAVLEDVPFASVPFNPTAYGDANTGAIPTEDIMIINNTEPPSLLFNTILFKLIYLKFYCNLVEPWINYRCNF